MPRAGLHLVSACLLVCVVLATMGAFAVPQAPGQQGSPESSFVVPPATPGDLQAPDWRRCQVRLLGRLRNGMDLLVADVMRLRQRLRLSSMECPEEHPCSQSLLGVMISHLRMGNSDSDHASRVVS